MIDQQNENQLGAALSPTDPKESNNASVFDEVIYFNKKMYDCFLSGKLPHDFSPYFRWKFESHDCRFISKAAAFQMRDLAQELLEEYYDKYPEAFSNVEIYHYTPENYDIEESLWCSYKGFKGDMYIVSFLEKIDGELSELIASGILK